MMELKVVPIRNGTVLDHIAPGKSLAILQTLGLPVEGSSKVISLSMNLPGSRGLKDVLKFEDIELSEAEIASVKTISPHGTHCLIRNFDVADKFTW